jgi:hypothetical protein
MTTDIEGLIKILEESVKRNGEKPLTNKWLLNICKMVNNCQINESEYDIEDGRPDSCKMY